MLVSLWDFQVEAVNRIRQSYIEAFRAPLLVLPTGSGKTVIFTHIMERVAARGRRVYVLVHRQELLRQTSDHLDRLGVPHGRVAPGYLTSNEPVQIASVQTLVRRLGQLPEPDLLIIDEAHHAGAETWKKIIRHWPAARLLGVTATPCRMDGAGLGVLSGGFFDTLIEGPSVRWLIDNSYLSTPVVYAPPSGVDLAGIKIQAGDFEHHELSVRMDKPKITGCAIEHYMRLTPGYPAIAFCASVEHSEHVAQQFNDAGISSVSLTGDLPDTVRKHRVAALAAGGIRVLTSCDIISEGTDIPVVAAAILLRPTQSLGLYLQQVGRALRTYPGKTHATILDHAGNCLRHGLPDDERVWVLNAEKKQRSKKTDGTTPARISMCPKCYAMMSAAVSVCPQCGHVREVNGREVKQVAGTLQQVTREGAEEIRRQHAREQGMAKTLSDLVAVARARGYNPGWAYKVFNGRKAREFRQAVNA